MQIAGSLRLQSFNYGGRNFERRFKGVHKVTTGQVRPRGESAAKSGRLSFKPPSPHGAAEKHESACLFNLWPPLSIADEAERARSNKRRVVIKYIKGVLRLVNTVHALNNTLQR